AGWVLERAAKLPIVKVASGIGGGLVACAKAVLLLWCILFVALFFPISPEIRAALRASPSARTVDALDIPAYAMIEHAMPRPVRVVTDSILKHHRI
ncbi:MAG TPA: hypothetical protein VEJ20_03175, partial [Candidatus Eremiobacteraceae bacterium]|nr:hypothetical protein [Candidatus Eremiobacteraceae bacterium]